LQKAKNGGRQKNNESLGQSAGKALDILDSFSSERPLLSVAEAAEALHVTPSTASRLLATLESRGYVVRDSKRSKYRLGLAALALAGVAASQMELRNIAWPYIRDLADQTHCTANLAVKFNDKALFMISIYTADTKDVRGKDVPGRQLPLYCTGVGKVLLAGVSDDELEKEIARQNIVKRTANTIADAAGLLAEIQQVRSQGYALDREEEMLGSNCLAVPVRGENMTIAAVSVSAPAHRYPIGQIEQFTETLMNTVYHLSLSLAP
jgi:IclR family KDG regulon transcriptional repressor